MNNNCVRQLKQILLWNIYLAFIPDKSENLFSAFENIKVFFLRKPDSLNGLPNGLDFISGERVMKSFFHSTSNMSNKTGGKPIPPENP